MRACSVSRSRVQRDPANRGSVAIGCRRYRADSARLCDRKAVSAAGLWARARPRGGGYGLRSRDR
eukprot:6053533-Prymnesium_polylepis.1